MSMSQETILFDSMGRPLNSVPTYVYHPRGIGRIYWRGEFRNLPGDYNSAESLAAFHRLCQIVAVSGRLPEKEPDLLTIAGLVDRFAEYAERRYAGSNEARNLAYATLALMTMFAGTHAIKFGPQSLKAVRASIVEAGLCRNTANKRTRQIVSVFAWAVEEELIPPDVWQALKAVRPIPRGRDGAIDFEPVRPVDPEHYKATILCLPPRIKPAIEVQRMTGMRSGELLAMRPQDVDMHGTHWFYRLKSHKTAAIVGERIIGIPSTAAEILVECMPRTFADRWFPWRVDSHYHAVTRACVRASVPEWHPHRLRHGIATLCEELFGDTGPEAARLLMGHTDIKTTRRYVMATTESMASILDQIAPRIR